MWSRKNRLNQGRKTYWGKTTSNYSILFLEIDGIVNVAMDFKEEHPAGFSANRHEHQITEL